MNKCFHEAVKYVSCLNSEILMVEEHNILMPINRYPNKDNLMKQFRASVKVPTGLVDIDRLG